MTVTSTSACNSPADSSVWSSSTSTPSARTSTLRILCSTGSSQCFISWSIAFNFLIWVVGATLTVRSPPSKVFTFNSHFFAGMAAREDFHQDFFGRRSRCVSPKCEVPEKSTTSLLKCTSCDKFKGSVIYVCMYIYTHNMMNQHSIMLKHLEHPKNLEYGSLSQDLGHFSSAIWWYVGVLLRFQPRLPATHFMK